MPGLSGSDIQIVDEFIARCSETLFIQKETEVEIATGTGHQIARLTPISTGNLVRIRSSRELPLMVNQPVVFIRQGGSTILGGGRALWLGSSDREQRAALARIEPTLGM